MDRGRVEEDRGSKETDGCPLTDEISGSNLASSIPAQSPQHLKLELNFATEQALR
jgi:hypothetical protein